MDLAYPYDPCPKNHRTEEQAPSQPQDPADRVRPASSNEDKAHKEHQRGCCISCASGPDLARCAENATHGENSGVTHGRTEQAGDGRDNDIEKTYHASPFVGSGERSEVGRRAARFAISSSTSAATFLDFMPRRVALGLGAPTKK